MNDVIDERDAFKLVSTGIGSSSARIEILQLLLARQETSVGDLMRETGLTRNGVRRHIDELGSAKLITNRRTTHPRGSGPITYWTANRAAVEDLVDTLRGLLLDN